MHFLILSLALSQVVSFKRQRVETGHSLSLSPANESTGLSNRLKALVLARMRTRAHKHTSSGLRDYQAGSAQPKAPLPGSEEMPICQPVQACPEVGNSAGLSLDARFLSSLSLFLLSCCFSFTPSPSVGTFCITHLFLFHPVVLLLAPSPSVPPLSDFHLLSLVTHSFFLSFSHSQALCLCRTTGLSWQCANLCGVRTHTHKLLGSRPFNPNSL